MKYQIYLNKETTTFINKLAETSGKKAPTLIKELVESFVKLSKPLEDRVFEEVAQDGAKRNQ